MKVLKSSFSNLTVAAFLLAISAFAVFGQQPVKSPAPTFIPNREEGRMLPVAAGNNLYCAGYIQNSPVNQTYEIVGADREREQNIFRQGDYVYIGRGANGGVKVGDRFSVVRPRGKFKSKFSAKGNLGIYMLELGAVEVVRVKPEVSVARVKTSCDNFLLGDLLEPMPTRTSPMFENRPALDLFAEPTGKATGRIVLARDAREAPSKDEIVYIDLGAEDNVRVGDYLTIYRKLGKGGILNSHQDDTHVANNDDFGSEAYKGGKFSISAPRPDGSEASGKPVTYNDVTKRRPGNLRQILGEMVILNVKERTATAVITRVTQEIHTGDMVEVQ